MTYGQQARNTWGNFYFAWLKGWNGEPLTRIESTEYAKAAWDSGSNNRREIVRDNFNMLTER